MTKNMSMGIFILVIVVAVIALFVQQQQNTKNPLESPVPTFAAVPNKKGTTASPAPRASQTPQATGTQSSSTETLPDGLQIEDIKIGTGSAVKSGDTITVNYVGYLTNGTKFDSSIDRGTPFTTQIGMGQVIKGWDEGIIGMRVGGERRLIVPPSLGYGSQSVGSIPANSTLIFEVFLLAIK